MSLPSSKEKGEDPSQPLGEMPSMSPECTPLKRQYDGCFNRWFEEYLGLREEKQSSGSFWSSSKITSSAESIFSSPTSNQRQSLRQRLDGECGKFWKEYQNCVLKAVKERDLEGLIKEARQHNPFPFPKDLPKDGRPNNEPFPFPSAGESK